MPCLREARSLPKAESLALEMGSELCLPRAGRKFGSAIGHEARASKCILSRPDNSRGILDGEGDYCKRLSRDLCSVEKATATLCMRDRYEISDGEMKTRMEGVRFVSQGQDQDHI